MTALNFPANPTNGQTYENYVYDGTDGVWKRISPGGTLGNIDDVTIDSPADGESLVYDSATGDWINADATVEVYGVGTAATDYFMIPVGGDAARPVTPANGHIRFNSDSGEPEYYSEAESAWFLFRQAALTDVTVDYLVVAGGGGGGSSDSAGGHGGGGGGAGGYRTSAGTSGRLSSAENSVTLSSGTYSITVGAGGPGGTVHLNGVVGQDSTFASITSSGGGGGGATDTAGAGSEAPTAGGSGGGGGARTGSVFGAGTVNQGFDGGSNNGRSSGDHSGGGGGAGAQGQAAPGDNDGGDGGAGIASLIAGSSVTRGGGGGGGAFAAGSGGAGGGGNGANTNSGTTTPSPGQSNTGGGGGGAGYNQSGAAGGSGVVVLRIPASVTPSFSVGLVELNGGSGQQVGDFKIYTITAGTGDVTF